MEIGQPVPEKIFEGFLLYTVQPAKRLYPSRLRTWNFASHVTFLRGFCVEVAWVLRGISEKVA